MRFSTQPHPLYCGIALHARPMDVCILPHDGALLLHRAMQARPEPFLQASAPSREESVGAVECLLTWDWLAALGAHDGVPCVRGQALSMQAIHGGTAQNARIDARQSAV